MRLLIKQHFFSWGEKFDIYDEADQVRYRVRGEVFSIGSKLHVYDPAGNEVGFVRQKPFSLLPKYFIEQDGRALGAVTKKFSFKPRYLIDYNGWDCKGDFTGWNYLVEEPTGAEVARIHKELFHWGDTYVIDYYRQQDELPVLMLVLAIDAANAAAAAAASD